MKYDIFLYSSCNVNHITTINVSAKTQLNCVTTCQSPVMKIYKLTSGLLIIIIIIITYYYGKYTITTLY